MWESLPEGKRQQLLDEVPGKKLIPHNDIVASVRYLMSTMSLNGVNLPLDYGLSNGLK